MEVSAFSECFLFPIHFIFLARFLTTSTPDRTIGDVFRVVASEPETNVLLSNGSAYVIENRGDFLVSFIINIIIIIIIIIIILIIIILIILIIIIAYFAQWQLGQLQTTSTPDGPGLIMSRSNLSTLTQLFGKFHTDN